MLGASSIFKLLIFRDIRKPWRYIKISIKWRKTEDQNFLKSLKRHSKSKKSYKINESPKSKISFRCVKLRENPENLGFTFFGFLPPYLGVSDSLVYFKRRGLKRSIVWYKNFLISCLVAWYSAVFVSKSKEIHGNAWKSMEVGVGMGVCLSARSFMWGEVFGMLNKLAVQQLTLGCGRLH